VRFVFVNVQFVCLYDVIFFVNVLFGGCVK
jgi:hypothetical protein